MSNCVNSCTWHSLRIDRCVCVNVTFAQMRAFADERGATNVAQLRSAFGCAEHCGRCEPYIERMLESRTVIFNSVLTPRMLPRGT